MLRDRTFVYEQLIVLDWFCVFFEENNSFNV